MKIRQVNPPVYFLHCLLELWVGCAHVWRSAEDVGDDVEGLAVVAQAAVAALAREEANGLHGEVEFRTGGKVHLSAFFEPYLGQWETLP